MKQFFDNQSKTYKVNKFAKNSGNRIVIFSAPPGAGKTSVINAIIDLNYEINKLFEKYSLPRVALTFVPGVTTRQLRQGEKNGYDFQFLTTKQFLKRQKNKDFLLSFISDPNLYAVDGPDIEKKLVDSDSQTVFIYNLNAWQVNKLKKHFIKKPKVVFLNAPSAKELEKRKSFRGGMSKEELAFRRKTAREEAKQGNKISNLQVINDDFVRTIETCLGYILGEMIFKNAKITKSIANQIQKDIRQMIKNNSTKIKRFIKK